MVHRFMHGIKPPTCCDSNLNGHGTPGVLCQSFLGSFVAVNFGMLGQTPMPDETMSLDQGIIQASCMHSHVQLLIGSLD